MSTVEADASPAPADRSRGLHRIAPVIALVLGVFLLAATLTGLGYAFGLVGAPPVVLTDRAASTKPPALLRWDDERPEIRKPASLAAAAGEIGLVLWTEDDPFRAEDDVARSGELPSDRTLTLEDGRIVGIVGVGTRAGRNRSGQPVAFRIERDGVTTNHRLTPVPDALAEAAYTTTDGIARRGDRLITAVRFRDETKPAVWRTALATLNLDSLETTLVVSPTGPSRYTRISVSPSGTTAILIAIAPPEEAEAELSKPINTTLRQIIQADRQRRIAQGGGPGAANPPAIPFTVVRRTAIDLLTGIAVDLGFDGITSRLPFWSDTVAFDERLSRFVDLTDGRTRPVHIEPPPYPVSTPFRSVSIDPETGWLIAVGWGRADAGDFFQPLHLIRFAPGDDPLETGEQMHGLMRIEQPKQFDGWPLQSLDIDARIGSDGRTLLLLETVEVKTNQGLEERQRARLLDLDALAPAK